MEKPTIQEVETWLMKLYTTSQESITATRTEHVCHDGGKAQ